MNRLLISVTLLAFVLGGCTTKKTDTAEPASNKTRYAKNETVHVDATEYAFDPDTLRVPAGKIRFEIENIGSAVHEFEVFKAKKLIDEVEDISPGLTLKLAVTLKKGTYEYACKLEDHYQRGMKGTLRVN